jgi:hypothetical protein
MSAVMNQGRGLRLVTAALSEGEPMKALGLAIAAGVMIVSGG